MRRVGKSTILSQIKNDILLDINEHDNIFINFESFKFSKIKDSEDLYGYVEDIIENSKGIDYYQVSYLLESEKTRKREFGVYKKIKDNYPKYVISMNDHDFSQNGIIHKKLIDFLLKN